MRLGAVVAQESMSLRGSPDGGTADPGLFPKNGNAEPLWQDLNVSSVQAVAEAQRGAVTESKPHSGLLLEAQTDWCS